MAFDFLPENLAHGRASGAAREISADFCGCGWPEWRELFFGLTLLQIF
jgi:hypothetical protein